MTTAGDGGDGGDGTVYFNPDVLAGAEKVMAGRPEQPAKLIVDKLTFEAAAFGTVPGAAEATTRMATWVDQTRTELGRVGAEVADLEVRCRHAKQMAIDADPATRIAAQLGSRY